MLKMSIAVKKIAGGKPPAQLVEKVCIYKNRANSLSL
jgi:hypothetical protein